VIPVVSTEQMKVVDRAAPEPVEVTAGRLALCWLGGAYG